MEKYQKLESALSQGGISSQVTTILGDFKNVFSQDFGTFVNDEPLRIFGELHGTGEDFARLQGMYREAMYNVDLLREKLIASEKARVTGTSGIDQSRNNDALKREIQSQQEEIRSLRSQGITGGSNQEYETKIRTLQSRIQDLESQIRTSKLDYDNQIRSYTSKIENLERQVKLTNTPKSEISGGSTNIQSGYTPVAASQNFGTTSVTTPQKAGSSYGYTPSYTGTGSLSTPGATSQVVGKPSSGNVTGESSYSYSSSSSSATTPRTGTTGATSILGATGTTGATGTYGTTNYGNTSYGATGTYGASSVSSSGLSNSGVRTSGAVGGTTYGATSGNIAFGTSSGTLSSSGTGAGYTSTSGTTYTSGTGTSTGYNTGSKTGYTYNK
jgi:hypothetical protein